MSDESGKISDPNFRQEVRTSITPDETIIETITYETITQETETKDSTEPFETSEKNSNYKEPSSEKQIPTEENVREIVIDAPTVVQTIETLTAHTKDDTKSAQS